MHNYKSFAKQMANINASFKQQVLRILSNFKKVHELKDEESTILFTVFRHSMIYTAFAFIVMDNYFRPTIQSRVALFVYFVNLTILKPFKRGDYNNLKPTSEIQSRTLFLQ